MIHFKSRNIHKWDSEPCWHVFIPYCPRADGTECKKEKKRENYGKLKKLMIRLRITLGKGRAYNLQKNNDAVGEDDVDLLRRGEEQSRSRSGQCGECCERLLRAWITGPTQALHFIHWHSSLREWGSLFPGSSSSPVSLHRQIRHHHFVPSSITTILQLISPTSSLRILVNCLQESPLSSRSFFHVF